MREKRAWPPRDKEDRAESVAFEEAVAVVKETAVRSREVLSSAKEDLSDHQRWLEIQTAAVKADRARHDRWLQRQRERQEALERREAAKLRRRQLRQRAVRAVTSTASAGAHAVSSAFWLVVGKVVAGLNYIDALEAAGRNWVGTRVRNGTLYVARLVSRGAAWSAKKTGEFGRASGRAISAGSSFTAAKTSAFARSTGKALSAGSSVAAAKTSALARSTGKALSTGSSVVAVKTSALARSTASVSSAGFAKVSAKVHEVTPSVARFLSICFSGLFARAHDLSRMTGRALRSGSSVIAAKTDAFARSAGQALAPALARAKAKAYEVAPSLAEQMGKAGVAVRTYAGQGAAKVAALIATTSARQPEARIAQSAAGFARSTEIPVIEGRLTEDAVAEASQGEGTLATGPLAAAEKALSLPRAIGGFELSQMLIIAGAVLLVLGGLMLGGGLILRAGTPAQVGAVSADAVVWFFEQEDLPIAERSIFIFTGTPDGVRIKGFSINAENRSDQPLTGVGGVIKPDVEGPDMTLSMSIDMPKGEASIAHPEPNGAQGGTTAVVPPHSVFRLVFPFPEEGGEHDGVTAEEVVQTFGGLMLKVHYDVGGKEKAFMQYLSPSMLKDQLAEIETSAKGS